MVFSFQNEPKLEQRRCAQCGTDHDAIVGIVLRDGAAYAAYWLSWYPDRREAWLDVTLGTWQEPDYPDQVTFGCRIGLVDENASGRMCTLVPAAQHRSDSPMFGRKLSREEALAHPWVDYLWEVVDWLVVNDPTLREHIYEWRQ